MVFNNSDGKSEVGSNCNKAENEEQMTRREKKENDSGSGKGKKFMRSQIKTVSKNSQRSQKAQNVDGLIDRVKLIDQFESVKYN